LPRRSYCQQRPRAHNLLLKRLQRPQHAAEPSIDFFLVGRVELVQRYLQKKASMPPCPRCGDRMNVIKHWKHNSPTVGELQQYFCKPCNHEFTPFPELPPREDVEPCPECGRRGGVSKNGIVRPKSHRGHYQRFYCRLCNRWFQSYPDRWKKPKPPCPYCNGESAYSNGWNLLKSGTVSMRFECQDCMRNFTVHKMRT
jgi:transposase-like protein